MKRLVLPAILFSGWMALLFTDIPVKDSFLPSLGRFLSPFQGIWQSISPDTDRIIFKGNTKDEVVVLFDERDVPHIYARNLEDAIYAQGYLHAANRLFSMDISTRSPAGRLSEIIGPRTLAIDRRQRERGFEYTSILKARHWEAEAHSKSIISAYVQGVNDYVQSLAYKDWPLEYKLLSHEPVIWTSTHTALMATNLAITLCLRERDLAFTHARSSLSPALFDFLFPEYNPKESPVIPPEKVWDFKPVEILSVPQQPVKPPVPGSGNDRGQRDKAVDGSNNWALAGSKTANGYPLLANDPHLSLTLPAIWYEMEIHTPEMSVHGVSIPGLPFIIIGFNERVAWGTTNSGQDVLDWYRITWRDEARTHYQLDGKDIEATLRPEVIEVRGAKPVIDTIRYTRFGPVSHTDEYKDLAMKWIGHQRAASNEMNWLEKINKARTVNDYREAVAHYQYPAQNKIFASADGDIAITVAGDIPLRGVMQGESIVDGAYAAHDWQGFIPFAHAPFILNPSTGYVSSANQRPVDMTYPYPVFGRRTFEDYRGRTLNDRLGKLTAATVEDMKALQQSNFSLHAAEMLPLLIAAVKGDACITGNDIALLRRLEQWNFEYHRDSLSPVLFDLWYRAFESLVWDELDTMGVMRPEDWRQIEIASLYPDHEYFDLVKTAGKKETMTGIACLAFLKMTEDFAALPERKQASWGAYMESFVPHLARFPGFGADNLHASGHHNALNAVNKSFGPSWRMIVELSSPPKAWVVYPGGQSGDPASPHYRDMMEEYLDGNYYEVAIRKDAAAWQPARKIQIQPR